MTIKRLHIYSTYLIASIWFINGLVCKVLNFVPRHEEIVGTILGFSFSRHFTFIIGVSEIIMSIWILSRFKPKLNATLQIILIIFMNLLEFIIVPNLLLWGRFNSIFALLLISFIYFNEFILSKKLKIQAI